MKHIFITIAFTLVFISSMGAMPTDSLMNARENIDCVASDSTAINSIAERQLEEIIVTASDRYVSVNKASYIPTRQQKIASHSGTALLYQLAIPQLQVDPLTGSVTTVGGQAVSYFIDGVPSSAEDVAGMNTRDVMRVEVLDHPIDPKFRNAPHVVNFIMREYEYGGYTKLNTVEDILNGISTANLVNSKFVYRKMTFDGRVNYNYSHIDHNGSDYTQTFCTNGFENAEHNDIERKSRLLNSKKESSNTGASLRALYDSDKTQISSNINWTYSNLKANSRNSMVEYSPVIFEPVEFSMYNPNQSNSWSWMNTFYQILPREWSLSGGFYLYYSRYNHTQSRKEGEYKIRDIRINEKAINSEALIMASKRIQNNNLLSFELTGKIYSSDISYEGTVHDDYERIQKVLSPGATYTYFSHNGRFTGALNIVGLLYQSQSNNIKETILSPTVTIQTQWMPHNKHRFGFVGSYALEPPSGSQTNPVRLQSDMLMWSEGNPYLKTPKSLFLQASHFWMPSQSLNVQSIATWSHKKDYIAEAYLPIENGKALLATPQNCGNYNSLWSTVNIAAYAFGRKLVIQAKPTVVWNRFSGLYDISHASVSASFNATYYYKNFFFGCSYATSKRSHDGSDPVYNKIKSQYWLTVGWGDSSWNVQAYYVNPFRTDWRTNSSSFTSEYYKFTNQAIGISTHQRINFSLTYTFGYGKKIPHSNDLQESTKAESSIR